MGGVSPVQMGGALQYKLEVDCGVSLSPKLKSQRGTVLQMGGRIAVQIGGVPPVLCIGCTDKGSYGKHSVLGRVLRRFWEGFWGRGLRRVLRRGVCYGFYSLKGF